MTDGAIYISTLSRPDNLRKVIPYWLEQELPIRLVVERREFALHNKLIKDERWNSNGGNITVIPLPLASRGLGYSRWYCVTHAGQMKMKSIVLADDDLYPRRESDYWDLLEAAEHPKVLGIGATCSLYDRFTSGAMSKLHGVILCSGVGFQCYAVNVATTLSIGNFDPNLSNYGEDLDLAMEGISHGIPWMFHCDVKFNFTGKRHDPGGHSARFKDQEARAAAEQVSMNIVRERWPDFTSGKGKKPRIFWKKLLDECIPNWKEMSALHGGSLDKYWQQGEE